MAVTVNVNKVNFSLSTSDVAISPTGRRGVGTFNAPLLPQPPASFAYENHDDPAVRELIRWAKALSIKLSEILEQ